MVGALVLCIVFLATSDSELPVIRFEAVRTSNESNGLGPHIVTFEETLLNEGAAMDAESGKFSALLDGLYRYCFSIKDCTGLNKIICITGRVSE